MCSLRQVLEVPEQQFFETMGTTFVNFVGQYGYDRVLSVLGRHVRDFLNGTGRVCVMSLMPIA